VDGHSLLDFTDINKAMAGIEEVHKALTERPCPEHPEHKVAGVIIGVGPRCQTCIDSYKEAP
jgi:hypothetical protein